MQETVVHGFTVARKAIGNPGSKDIYKELLIIRRINMA